MHQSYNYSENVLPSSRDPSICGQPHGTGAWISTLLQMSVDTGRVENTFLVFICLSARPVAFFLNNRKHWTSGQLLKNSHQKILIFKNLILEKKICGLNQNTMATGRIGSGMGGHLQ